MSKYRLILLATTTAATLACGSSPTAPREVMALKDMDRLTLINDAEQPLENCRITIQGDYTADLDLIPARGRATIQREAFSGGHARDEWFKRVLRSLDLRCLDDQDKMTAVRVR